MNKRAALLHDNELECLMALSLIKDIGPVTAKKLLSAFRSPQSIFEAGFDELRKIDDISDAKAKRIKGFNSWEKVAGEIESAEKLGIRIIKYTDREYPEPLRQIEDSPVLLYANGSLIEEDRYSIAIVGSRNMTEYGRKAAGNIAYELASCGLTVVSGMARGIDTAAHKGALKADGRSIAVLGCGLDKPYPPENMPLFGQLSRSGCVISEFPVGTPPLKENFPRRNRLISGLSLGVLVVEAATGSGSLITANCALEQGKDVFAVPGSISYRNSEGTNSLIKKGAKLVQKTEDILEELAPVLKNLLGFKGITGAASAPKTDKLEINDEEKAICNILGSGARHIDEISRELKITPAKLSGLLLNLEIKGIIRQSEGKNFNMLREVSWLRG